MKKRLFTAMLLLMLAVSQFPVQLFANTGSTKTVNDWNQFENALKDTKYSTITLGNKIRAPRRSDDAPLVINRDVTINGAGNEFTLNTGGIILGGNVTFENLTITFENAVRNAIIANGYNLTLNNVKSGHSIFLVNVFAGEMTDYTGSGKMPESGKSGNVTVNGESRLGQIFAGSLAEGNPTTPPQPNKFEHPSTITINASKGSVIGDIYAHGAYEPRDGSNPGGMVGDANLYQVTGEVNIELNSSSIKNVYGKTGGTTDAKLVYNDKESLLNTNLMLKDLSSLEVTAGKLSPRQGSTFNKDANINISGANSQLNLGSYGNISIKDLTVSPDAYLILGNNQTLTVNGSASENIKVAIDGVFNHISSSEPTINHTYLIAKNAKEDAFVLLPKYNSDLYFVKDANGKWTVKEKEGIVVKTEITDFDFIEKSNVLSQYDFKLGDGTTYELICGFKDGKGSLNEIPMNYIVTFGNTKLKAKTQADGYAYLNNLNLKLYLQGDGQDNYLFIEPINSQEAVNSGIYEIDIEVPVNKVLVTKKLQLIITNDDGTIPPIKHEHVWNYRADGSRIIAECAGIGDCDVTNRTATLQLKAPTNLVYDGNAKEATVEGNVPGVVTPTVTYANGTTPVNAGNYEASISLGQATAKLSYDVLKAQGNGTVSIDNWTEGEQAKQPVSSTTTNDATKVSYEYKLKDTNDSYQSFKNTPSVAGNYVLKATFEATQNYQEVITYADFTIHKKSIPSVDKTIIQNELTSVPSTLSQFQTVEELKAAMEKEILTQDGYTKENTKFLDIKMKVSKDNGKTYIDATEKDFPKDGIVVEFFYKDLASGVGKDTHDFMVTHMFTLTSNHLGTIAGEIEKPQVTKLDDRIRVTLRGLSPVSISWKPINNAGGSTIKPTPLKPSTVVVKPTPLVEAKPVVKSNDTGKVTTGDTTNEPLLWGTIVGVVVLAGALFYIKKRSSK